jgi:hypothetical protein
VVQDSDGPREAKGLQSPELGGTPVIDDVLVIAVSPLAGGTSRIEDLPGFGPPLNGANQAWVLVEGHAVRIASDLLSVRTLRPFGKGTLEAADILAAVGLVVVAARVTQTPAGSIWGAVAIIPPLPKNLWGEVFSTRMIGDDGEPSAVPDPVVVLDRVGASLGELDLAGQEGEGDLGAMLLEVTPLMGIGRVGGMAHGQLQPEFDVDIRGLLLQVAEDKFFLVRGGIVDMISYLGL